MSARQYFGLAALTLTLFAACSRDTTLPPTPPNSGFLSGRAVVAVPGSGQSRSLPGAAITVLSSNLHAVADDQGAFIIGPLPKGKYGLYLTGTNSTGVQRQRLLSGIGLVPGATGALGDVSLQENAQLTGHALIQGKGAGNVGILVFAPGTDFVTTTSDSGAYLLSNLPEGTLRVSAFRPGFAPATTTDITLQGGIVTSAVDLVLEPESAQGQPASISGTVVVVDRPDNAGAKVRAWSVTQAKTVATTTTDSSGAFALQGLPSDLYTLLVDLDGYPSGRVPNLAVGSGVALVLSDPIVLAGLSPNNVASDGGIGSATVPPVQADGGPVTSVDGGQIGAACGQDNDCASGRLCVEGRCVGCSTTTPCRPGYSCRSGDCVRDCVTNAECSNGQACLAGICGPCVSSADCKDALLVCNPQSQCAHCRDRSECPAGKACLATGCGDCNLDADCGGGALCEAHVCVSGNCHSDADCPTNQACVGRTCGACSADSQCRANQLCLATACALGNCRGVTECAPGQVCLGNQCGACANDGDCGAGQLCLPGASGLRCSAATCRSASDCTGASAGYVCVVNQCAPCGSSTSCGAGQVCNAQSRCVVGDCLTAADCTGSKAGWACKANVCTPCSVNTDCAASGYVCASGVCKVGNCSQAIDCPVPGQLCVANTCTGCTTTADCPAGNVCDADQLCHPGNCVTTADCATLAPGKVCTARTCASCSLDTQCVTGKICVAGSCVTGVCHSDVDCSGGQRLCDTVPTSPTAFTCKACTPANTVAGTTCGLGRVCDLLGFCHVGSCVQNSNCPAGQVCLGFACSTCSLDSQCSGGQLCVNTVCKTGNCHGTGADPNLDCAATTGVCVNNVCAGNCRGNADCASTGYCNQASHLCDLCTGLGQCGAGKVCNPGTGGATCVTGQCSSLEPNCATGFACVANLCKQVAPTQSVLDGGYLEPGTINTGAYSPMPLSGSKKIYLSMPENASSTGAGSYTVALDSNLSLVWRVRDSTGTNRGNGQGGQGIVLPAPGFPDQELFLVNDGIGGAIAHRADTGATVWRLNSAVMAFATGIASGVPMVAWFGGNTTVSWMRTDGTGLRTTTLAGCTYGPDALAFGTAAIYYLCNDLFYIVDPVTGAVTSLAHNNNPANLFGNYLTGALAVWRPPTGYVTRGVTYGSVTSDLVVYMGRYGGFDWMHGVNVPDDWASGLHAPTVSWATNYTTFYNTPVTLDSTGAAYVNGQSMIGKVSVIDGAPLAKVSLGSYTGWYNLAAGGVLVDVVGNTLQGYQIADGALATPLPLWTLPAAPGGYLSLFPNFQATAQNAGQVLAFQWNASAQPVLKGLPPASGSPSYTPTWPAWTIGGDSANHLCAPAYQCQVDTDCALTQSCVLGRCIGTCRDATQCGAGQGCQLGQCGNCSLATACRAGEVCYSGSCIACNPATQACCSTNTDCPATSYCASGVCATTPANGAPGSWTSASLITRTINGNLSVAGDGTLYVGDTDATGAALWKIVTPHGLVTQTTPVTGVLSGSQSPNLLIAKVGAAEALYFATAGSLNAAPAASTVGAWAKSAYTSGIRTLTFQRMAQGMSSALGTGPQPTLFITATDTSAATLVLAVDAATALNSPGANAGLLWIGMLGPSCTLPTSADHVMVGTDGAVYVACADGTVEAWAPDGNPATGSPPSRLGLMAWRSAAPSWASVGAHPAIGHAASGDVLYLGKNGAAGLAVLPVSYGPLSTKPIELGAIDSSVGAVTDAAGNGIFLGAHEVSAVSPTGALLSDNRSNWWPTGHGYVLTAEGLLMFPDNGSPNFQLSAVSVGNVRMPTSAFSLLGPGNLPLDTSSSVAVVPGAVAGLAGGAGLLVWDQLALGFVGTVPRTVTGLPFGTAGQASGPSWSSVLGDLHRRSSLKTQ